MLCNRLMILKKFLQGYCSRRTFKLSRVPSTYILLFQSFPSQYRSEDPFLHHIRFALQSGTGMTLQAPGER